MDCRGVAAHLNNTLTLGMFACDYVLDPILGPIRHQVIKCVRLKARNCQVSARVIVAKFECKVIMRDVFTGNFFKTFGNLSS